MTEQYDQYRHDTAKRWLDHIRKLGAAVESARELVEDAKRRAYGVSGLDYSEERVSSSTDPDSALVDKVERVRESISAYVTKMQEYESERADAYERIARLDDATEIAALTSHYLIGNTWEQVCVDMNYSYGGIMKVRHSAVIHAYEVLPTEWRDPVHRAY